MPQASSTRVAGIVGVASLGSRTFGLIADFGHGLFRSVSVYSRSFGDGSVGEEAAEFCCHGGV